MVFQFGKPIKLLPDADPSPSQGIQAMSSSTPDHHRINLPTGTVQVSVRRNPELLPSLVDFAARNNTSRGFLVVSKVLGRHIPVRPSVMRRTFFDLAHMLPADLPGPVLMIGMAETATCLGQGIHEEYLGRTQRTDVVTMHSTRQKVPGTTEMLRFEEPHSHASLHILYEPHNRTIQNLVHGCRNLVLVDDEISTGTTLSNLAAEICKIIPTIEQIHIATLADWTGNQAFLDTMPVPAALHSLLAGTLDWEPNPQGLSSETPPRPRSAGILPTDYDTGRFGRNDIANDFDRLADTLDIDPSEDVLILGTGEFTYPPFRIAEILEQRGYNVHVQAVTRSPIHLGGAIKHSISLDDNYNAGVPNFLYNQEKQPGQRVIVCLETPRGSFDESMRSKLGAEPLYFDRRELPNNQ